MKAKIDLRHNVSFIKPRNFDAAYIKCFIEFSFINSVLSGLEVTLLVFLLMQSLNKGFDKKTFINAFSQFRSAVFKETNVWVLS